ncbi:MAG: hypothetical protein QXS45_04240 [Sulfolobales archaeon]
MRSLARIFILIYIAIVVGIYFYQFLNMVLYEVLGSYPAEQARLLSMLLASILPSILATIALRMIIGEIWNAINNLQASSNRINNMIDAYAVVMKRYEQDLGDIREALENIRRRESEIGVRLSALEKITSTLVELYTEQRSSGKG